MSTAAGQESSDPFIAFAAVIVGAVIVGLTSWLTTRRTLAVDQQLARAARDETRRQAITDRTSAFLAASYHGVLSLRDLALAGLAEKSQVEKDEVWPTVDRVNSALVAVQINDPEDVVRAVEAIDRAMVTLAREAKDLAFTHEEWRARRCELIGELPELAIQAARAHALQLQTGIPSGASTTWMRR